MNTEVPYAYPVDGREQAWPNFVRDMRTTIAPILCRVAWVACIGWTALIGTGLLAGEPPLTGGALILAGFVACRAFEGVVK